MAILVFEIMLMLAMASALFAADDFNDTAILSKEVHDGCTELGERLEIENIARAQFSCDMDSYGRNVIELKDKDELLISKSRF
ncbi:MAG: hypothetical protein WC738_03245 [Candidatus Omnitrophota bacterium]